MADRLNKIYTRTGDAGDTGKADGSRVKKDDRLVVAIGDIDELNSQLAIVICHSPKSQRAAIKRIQHELFDVGAELSMSCGQQQPLITTSHIQRLESELDALNGQLESLKEFILPGGGLAASHCHVARAVCRRAERSLVSLQAAEALNPATLAYINRLSDYLFVLARSLAKHMGEAEIYWQSEHSR